jgi:hypothetical protein
MSYLDLDRADAAASMRYPKPNHNNAAEYQQSGVPFVFYKALGDLSGAKIVTLTLPYVSRWIYLTLGGTLTNVMVGFSDVASTAGIQADNHIPAATLNGISVPLELKCKRILIEVPNNINDLTISLIAGLTSVREFPDIHNTADISGISTTAAVAGVAAAVYSIAAYSS